MIRHCMMNGTSLAALPKILADQRKWQSCNIHPMQDQVQHSPCHIQSNWLLEHIHKRVPDMLDSRKHHTFYYHCDFVANTFIFFICGLFNNAFGCWC
jgi:hypothetical protein